MCIFELQKCIQCNKVHLYQGTVVCEAGYRGDCMLKALMLYNYRSSSSCLDHASLGGRVNEQTILRNLDKAPRVVFPFNIGFNREVLAYANPIKELVLPDEDDQ